jgi:hypothetical protein
VHTLRGAARDEDAVGAHVDGALGDLFVGGRDVGDGDADLADFRRLQNNFGGAVAAR